MASHRPNWATKHIFLNYRCYEKHYNATCAPLPRSVGQPCTSPLSSESSAFEHPARPPNQQVKTRHCIGMKKVDEDDLQLEDVLVHKAQVKSSPFTKRNVSGAIIIIEGPNGRVLHRRSFIFQTLGRVQKGSWWETRRGTVPQ